MNLVSLGQRRAEKRKIEILEAALAVLCEDGYGHASMDKIAERALLTRVGLYKHFKDKSTLILALREYKLHQLAERIKNALILIPDFETRLRTIVLETIVYQRENQGFFRVLLASSFSNEFAVDLAIKPLIYTIAEVFQLGLEQKLIRQGSALEYAGLLTTLIFEPSIKRAFIPSLDDFEMPEHVARLIANLFLHGVMLKT
jgi:AcrR family transcriptional regulator